MIAKYKFLFHSIKALDQQGLFFSGKNDFRFSAQLIYMAAIGVDDERLVHDYFPVFLTDKLEGIGLID